MSGVSVRPSQPAGDRRILYTSPIGGPDPARQRARVIWRRDRHDDWMHQADTMHVMTERRLAFTQAERQSHFVPQRPSPDRASSAAQLAHGQPANYGKSVTTHDRLVTLLRATIMMIWAPTEEITACMIPNASSLVPYCLATRGIGHKPSPTSCSVRLHQTGRTSGRSVSAPMHKAG